MIGSHVTLMIHNHVSFGDSPLIPYNASFNVIGLLTLEQVCGWGDVVVCPSVTLDEGNVAGASAVVTTDVPPFTLVASVPARAIQSYDAIQGEWKNHE